MSNRASDNRAEAIGAEAERLSRTGIPADEVYENATSEIAFQELLDRVSDEDLDNEHTENLSDEATVRRLLSTVEYKTASAGPEMRVVLVNRVTEELSSIFAGADVPLPLQFEDGPPRVVFDLDMDLIEHLVDSYPPHVIDHVNLEWLVESSWFGEEIESTVADRWKHLPRVAI